MARVRSLVPPGAPGAGECKAVYLRIAAPESIRKIGKTARTLRGLAKR